MKSLSLLSPASTGDVDDPFSLLLACHERIRRHSALACRLARAPASTPPAELAEAAAQVVRYFARALPLHVEDEDRTLAPLLVTLDLGEHLRRMTDEHRDIEQRLAAVLPTFAAVMAAPAEHARLIEHLEALDALAELFDRHLAGEEQHILPAAAAALDDDARRRLLDAMRARRA